MKRLLACLLITISATAAPKLVRHEQGIPNEYVVVLPDGTPIPAVHGIATSLAHSYGLEVLDVYAASLQGFLVRAPESHARALSDDPRVLYVEQNVRTRAPVPPTSAVINTWFPDDGGSEYLWNLDRIDEVSYATRDSKYNMCTEGRSAYAYVIDYGIYGAHAEFTGTPARVALSVNFAGPANGAIEGNNGCGATFGIGDTYHGTAVASVLSGTNMGVSRAQLVSLRVFGCDLTLTTSDLLEAIDWIARDADPARIAAPRVINFSGYVPVWDGLFQSFGDAAARTVTSTGVPFFTSADNFSTDACKFSPNHLAYTRTHMTIANTPRRIFVVGGTSVSATPTDNDDYRWQEYDSTGYPRIGDPSGSNAGPCVSIYAPAKNILVATNSTQTINRYARYSGTSFSSPMVAGVAARYMERQRALTGSIPTWRQVYDFLLNQSVTVPHNTVTPPSYWICAPTTSTADIFAYPTIPNCPAGYTGPWYMPAVPSSTHARMLYWNEPGSDSAACP